MGPNNDGQAQKWTDAEHLIRRMARRECEQTTEDVRRLRGTEARNIIVTCGCAPCAARTWIAVWRNQGEDS